MKKSITSTAHVLIKASLSSDWDWCDFAIITLSESNRAEYQRRLEFTKPLFTSPDLYSISYWGAYVDYYQASEEEKEMLTDILGRNDWSFIEVTETEMAQFARPENDVRGEQMVIYQGGCAKFVAYGKHTGEEFATEEFSIAEIIAV